jgi:branched-chain amino acid transport system permease protein
MADLTSKLTQRISKTQGQSPQRKFPRATGLVLLVAAVILLGAFPLLPFVNNYLIDVGFIVGIYALLGLSLNIVLGEVGLFDLGHMAFCAIGAYTTGILFHQLHLPIVILLPISAIVAGGFAYLVTSPVIHLRGDYLCIVTIGIGEIVRLVLQNNPGGLTNGPNGIGNIGNPDFGLFSIQSPAQFYYYIWIVIGLVIIGLINLQKSRVGRAWNYIREDEIAAKANGIDVRSFKLLAFVLGAAIAGIAGNIYASKYMFIEPNNFSFMESALLFCIVLLGGLGSIPGSLLGAAVIVIFPEIFRQFASYRLLFFGAALIVMMIFRPGGLWPRRREGLGFAGLGIAKLPRDENALLAEAPVPPRPGTVPLKTYRLPPVTVAMSEGLTLETKAITLKFGGLVAVSNFDMSVATGKITSLIGPNGAGKTTLFNVITGIYRPNKGKVVFQGRDITKLKPHTIIGAGIARTFQNIRLFPSLTCIENVMSGPHCHAREGTWPAVFRTPAQAREERRIVELASYRLNQVGLWAFRNELAKNLPYGKQRLLELARALATSPSLLILDEPSSGLNDKETEDLMAMLQVFLGEGFTMLLIEHDMNVVMGISDWVTVMDMGSKIAEGPPQEIYNNPLVIEAYLGKEED